MAKRICWTKVRNEYIAGGISYRKLAQKYNIPLRTLEDRAKIEKWVDLRRQNRDKSVAKTIDALSNKEADRAARLVSVADKLLNQVENMVEGSSEPPTAKDIRSLTRALLDIKELQDIRSDLDTKEQEARIANLRRQATADEDKTSGIVVELEGGADDYAG